MKIKAIARKRVLTKINNETLKNGAKQVKVDVYPVVLYCNDRGKIYYVTTGLTTSNPDMEGHIFTDKEVSATENLEKSNRLAEVLDDVNAWVIKHHSESVESVKDGITKIVKRVAEKLTSEKTLADYIMEFAKNGEHCASTITCYEQTWKKVLAFDHDATLESVDEDWLIRFRNFMKDEGMTTNGYAIPLRNLRAVFNWARKKKKVIKEYPFENVHIKSARTKKTVLTEQDLADFRDFPCEEWQERYKDYFMLQFYLCGLDIVDLCHLKPFKGGRIRFYRQKNECREDMVEVDIPVCKEAMELIKKHRSKGNEYLLDCMDGRTDYKSFARQMNKALKKIGYTRICPDKLGKMRKLEYYPLLGNICTKTTRRTFATIARRLRVPEQLIGMALGHSWASSNTTQIYEWFDLTDMDKGIHQVINHVNSLKGRPKEVIIAEIMEREGL